MEASFPLMSFAEICDCLQALSIPIVQEDLQKPLPAQAQFIYSNLVQEIMGAHVEMIEGPKNALLGMIEYKVRSTWHFIVVGADDSKIRFVGSGRFLIDGSRIFTVML